MPFFSPLDEPEVFDAAKLPRLDFVFVDAGEKRSLPYTGARWYAAEVVQYMLEGWLRSESTPVPAAAGTVPRDHQGVLVGDNL